MALVIKYVGICSQEELLVDTANIVNYMPKDFAGLLGVEIVRAFQKQIFASTREK